MIGVDDIVITGLGCVTPIGIGREAFEAGLLSGKCGIQHHLTLDDVQATTYYAATIDDFDGKLYVTPRKALKVMSREVQLAYAAAHLAWQDADLSEFRLDPERMGVVFGSEILTGDHDAICPAVRACSESGQMDFSVWGREFPKHIYPLWMLRNLPNMPACHVGIAVDARGPNNTIAQEEVSSLLALAEAAMIIDRGHADLMVVGSVGNRVTPTRLSYRLRNLYDQHPFDPAARVSERCIPFATRRHGIVPSEGAGVLIIERRSHAVARGAKILARLTGHASRCGQPQFPYGGSRQAVADAARSAISQSGIETADLNHVCVQGYSEKQLDLEESHAIHEAIGNVPVSAFSSYFGTAGAASGILELMASLIGLRHQKRLATLNYQDTDPECPVNVCNQTVRATSPHFLKLSFTPFGHAAAAVIECEI